MNTSWCGPGCNFILFKIVCIGTSNTGEELIYEPTYKVMLYKLKI